LFAEFGGNITELGGFFTDTLMPAIMPIVDQVLPLLGQWFSNIMNLGSALVDTFIQIFPTLLDIFNTVFPIIVSVFETLYGVIGSLINNIVIPLLPMIATVIEEVWSVVKPILEPMKNLFTTIGDTVMYLIKEVVGPMIPVIGTVIGAMWDVVKPVLSAIVSAFGKIIDVIGNVIGNIKDMVSAFKSFKPPEWLSTIGGAVSGAAKKAWSFVSGSHATGLESVPYDGYIAELHKDEAVLTATQSNALRSAGILSNDGRGKPELDLSGNDSSSYKTTYSTSSNNQQVSAPIQIIVQGGDNPRETARSIKEEFEDFFADLMSVMPVPREG